MLEESEDKIRLGERDVDDLLLCLPFWSSSGLYERQARLVLNWLFCFLDFLEGDDNIPAGEQSEEDFLLPLPGDATFSGRLLLALFLWPMLLESFKLRLFSGKHVSALLALRTRRLLLDSRLVLLPFLVPDFFLIAS